jgi:head-tail adaptor
MSTATQRGFIGLVTICLAIMLWAAVEKMRAAEAGSTDREMHEQTVQLRRIADALEVLAGKRK